MPIGPQHLIDTQVGNNKSLRPNKLDADMTEQFIKQIEWKLFHERQVDAERKLSL
ncbi:hypothetical protein ACFO4O_14665 [Glaciecola siphonariae]|uniref:Uncharacterized protein n=1 Tax=Glaciecola siphonariae TaxID=521012 RepID=A0ABV9M183_9ALTE